MAASAAAAGPFPGLCPSYAVICSFLERYGAMLDLPELTFPQLERYIQDTSSVPKLLVDLHVKLLRKIGKSVSADRWEKHLVKICQEFNTTWAWELEKKGYKEMTVECKTGILKYLCESQFDDNVKFKTAINDEDPDKMRLQPIGRDKDGLMYWFQLDQYNNVRVYVEEQDDLDGSSWKCIVRERNDLAEMLALLKTQIDPSLLTKKDLEEGAQDENKENGGVKKIEDSSTEDEDKDPKDTNGAVLLKTESKEEHPLNEDSKLSVSDAKSPSNDIKDNRTESDSTVKPEKPEADGNDSVKRQTIKEEPVDVSESKEASDISATEPLSEKSSMALPTESGEEAKKKSPEELQRAMKNDQQAKIPLKKREMKLSEDFDGNSGGSIIVRNPSLPQVKEAPKVDGSNKGETVKDTISDQANGDTQRPIEKSFNNGLRESPKEKEMQKDSTDGKEKIAKGAAEHESEADEAKDKNTSDLPTVKDGKKDEQKRVVNVIEEAMEVTTSSESDRQKKPAETKEEKESPEASDKTKEPVSNEAKCTTAELPPSSKDEAINPSDNSLDIKGEERRTKCKEGVVTTPIIDNKAVSSIETHKKPPSKISQESDENKGTDVVISPSSSKSNHPEEPEKKEVASKDTHKTDVKEKEKPTCTKGFEKPSDCKRTAVIAKETGKPNPRAEGSKLTEKPAIIKENETQSSKKESIKAVCQKETETSSVIQKMEKLKQSNDIEKLDSGKETNTSSVIIKADKPPLEKDTGGLDSSKEKGESSVLKKTEKQEESKPTEKTHTETSVITKEKSKHPAETDSEVITAEKEKSGLEKDSEKAITSKDKKVTTISQVSETKIEKQTCPQPDLVKKVEKLATSVDTTSTKDTNKSSSLETETSKISKETEKLAETKPGAATEKLAVPSKDSNQQLPKTSASDKVSKESVETSLKKPTDKNTKIQEGSRQGSTKEEKSKKLSEDEVFKDQTPMECEEPLKEPATSEEEVGHKSRLNTTENEKDKSQDLEKGDDAKAGGFPETESKKEDCQDEKPSAEAEKSSDTKTKEVSEVDKPKDKEEKEEEKEEKEKEKEEKEEEEKEDKIEEGDSAAKQKAPEEGKGSSEVQEEGIRLKIKIPAHRRKAELQREERGDSESDTGEGRSLRRSPRICRPTPKVVEFQDRKMEKKQATSRVEKAEEGEKKEGEEEEEEEKEKEGEEEEDDEGKTVQKKPREKKVDEDGQPKSKGRKRRKTRWSNTRTRRKKKGSDDDGDDDEESESSYEEDTEDEDDSDEDYKVERNRKRRNRNRQRRSSDDSTSSDDDLPPNDDPCKHCGLPNHPELILLCDSCDNGYHTACLRPPLMIIPDGEWFCPPCQHKQLCDKLEEQLQNLDAALKKRERAERRKERLVYVGISVENIITSSVDVEEEKEAEVIKVKKEVKKSKSWGRRSTRAKKSISYRFDEFDEAIEEAIEEDIKEAEGGGAGRGKDMANITGHRGKDMSTILQGEEGKENGRPPRPNVGQRRKKRRRLNDLDSDSTMEEEESEDEFRLSDSTEEEEFLVSENEAESDAEINSNNDSDFGSTGVGPRCRPSRSRRPAKRRKTTRQPRRRRRPRGYSDDEEEETDEEEEEEMVTEGSSEFSDSDLDMSRRRSRRSKKKQVNYCETSESEGSRAETNRDKVKSLRRLTSSDSEASQSRGSDNEERERRVKRRADSSEEESRQKRRRLSLKRRRASEEDDDDSDESEEEERPVRKRVNRIDSDDEEEEEEEEEDKKGAAEQEDEEVLGKVANPLDYSLVELPPANGQSPMKGLEGFMNRPGAGGAIGAPDLMTHLGPKNVSATPAVAIAPNGLVSQEMAPQDDDEDDLLGVTDLVDYVCNSEQL